MGRKGLEEKGDKESVRGVKDRDGGGWREWGKGGGSEGDERSAPMKGGRKLKCV